MYECICGKKWVSEVPKCSVDENAAMDSHLPECPVYLEAQKILAAKSAARNVPNPQPNNQ